MTDPEVPAPSLLTQLDAAMADFRTAATWMRAPETIALAAAVCADLGIAEQPRVILALLMMTTIGDGDVLEAGRDADDVMRREAVRFDRASARPRRRRGRAHRHEPTRCRRRFAWSSRTGHASPDGVGGREQGPPEGEALRYPRRPRRPSRRSAGGGCGGGGGGAATFEGAWDAVEGAAGLAQAVTNVARRPWDVVAARVAEGDDEPPRTGRELEPPSAPRRTRAACDGRSRRPAFSATWIRERAAAGALTRRR